MKVKAIFRCSRCGREAARWLGQCPDCEQWNSFEQVEVSSSSGPSRRRQDAERHERRAGLRIQAYESNLASSVGLTRRSTGFNLLDSCLGGGVVDGSVILLGGAPGVGKSTLAGQWAGRFAGSGESVLYCSSEEDSSQVAGRLSRLGVAASEKLLLASSLSLEDIVWKAQDLKPQLLVVDSVQTVAAEQQPYPVGSPSLIRAVTAEFLSLAKRNKINILLLGHVTKEGLIAGPKHMEHMVDVVLQMDQPRDEEYRILRVVKNRFGPANALAVFTMNARGLNEVADPAACFISANWRERLGSEPERQGLAASIAMDGTQPFLAQAEALVGRKRLTPGRRASLGVDRGRLEVLAAVLERSMGITLESCDIFLSLIGGMKVKDPGIDLALAMALASAVKEAGVPTDALYLGEVSLSGDVLPPRGLDARLRQGKALGYRRVLHAEKGFLRLKDFIATLTPPSREGSRPVAAREKVEAG